MLVCMTIENQSIQISSLYLFFLSKAVITDIHILDCFEEILTLICQCAAIDKQVKILSIYMHQFI